MDLLGYSDEFFQKALSRNIRVLTRGKSSVKKPLAILLGGQSGSGKTTIHRIKIEEYQGNLIVIDGDSFRYQHPNYNQLQEIYGKESVNYTRDFAGKMVEALIEQLSDRGYQLLIEGTLRTVEVPQKTATLLKTKNYTIELAVMATKPELSYLSTLIRYEELYVKDPNSARATPKEHHDAIVDHLVENLQDLQEKEIFDKIQIYQRDRRCCYDSSKDSESAAKVLHALLFGEWTMVEKEMLKLANSRLEELKGK